MSSQKKKSKKKKNNIQNNTAKVSNKKVDEVVEEKEVESKKEEIKEKETTSNKVEKKTIKKETKKTTEETKEVKIKKEKESKKEDNTQKDDTKKKTTKTKSKNEVAVEEKKDDIKEESKALTTIDDKPDYVKEMLKRRKIKIAIIIGSIVLALIILILSTAFALFNVNSNKIAKGVSIKGIPVSGLTIDETKSVISESLNKELEVLLKLKYDDEHEIEIKAEQIEFKYDVDSAVDETYKIAKTNSLVLNNYSLIFTKIFGRNVSIDYTYNEELLDNIIDDFNSRLPGVVVEPSYYIENNKLIVVKGKDGIKIKKDELKEQIIEKISSRSIFNLVDDNYKEEIMISIEDVKAEKIDMNKIYSEVHKEPQDAYFETEPYKIYKDVDGVDLFITPSEAQKEIEKEDKNEYSFDLKITKASKTINDLGTEAFPYLITSFTTKYDASNINRSTNLQIAASKINGTVLMPGEEFSFNRVVGKRTVEKGYRDAKIYADGGVVDGLAGGICQISSTLYNAVLLANLQIVERRNHSYPTSYLPVGKDATVVWGTTDFRFINSRSYPIKIEASVSNGIAEFKIHGIAEDTEYEIRILPSTVGTIPSSASYIPDPTLAPGQQVFVQRGTTGYRVITYKEVRLNGEVISNEIISNDTYSPMQSIIRIGQ